MTSESFRKISGAFQKILPGIFLLGFNIGTGSVTAMAKAGATYGMSLLWTIFLSCTVTYFMIVSYGRYTLITGETALYSFRKHIHPALGIFFIVALTTAVSASVIGVMGIIVDICHEWSKIYLPGGIHPLYLAALFIFLVYLLFWNGTTQGFQKALAVIVAVMAGSFIINFFILSPPPVEIFKGMLPRIPEVREVSGRGPFMVIASMVGTTVFSGLFIIRTTLVKEAGWTLKDLRIQRRDALISSLLMFIISATVMAAAAGTLYVNRMGLSHASQMIELLEPLAGRLATAIFVSGIVAAGLSSQLPNVLMLPWLLCDYNGTSRDMRVGKYRIMVLLISLLGFTVPLLQAPPVPVMIASQVFSALILPVTVFGILFLSNKKSLMGAHANKTASNIILALILLFALYMSSIGIKGIWESLFN
ncbi:MAG: Nramp family divalent metal transporter [Fidelibacterota bacterium]|nr:MAG: Nramp family divalent metal transporter [Candidatus Neomarinimicrobiota bacterium]